MARIDGSIDRNPLRIRARYARVEKNVLAVAGAEAEVIPIPVHIGMSDPETPSFGFGPFKKRTAEENEERHKQQERNRKWRAERERMRQVNTRAKELEKSPEFAGRIAEAKARIKETGRAYKQAKGKFGEWGIVKNIAGAFAKKDRLVTMAKWAIIGALGTGVSMLVGPAAVAIVGALLTPVFIVGAIVSAFQRDPGRALGFLAASAVSAMVASAAALILSAVTPAFVVGAALLGGAVGLLGGFGKGYGASRTARRARVLDPAEGSYYSAHSELRKIKREIYHRADSEIPEVS